MGSGMDHKSTWYCNAANKVKHLIKIINYYYYDNNNKNNIIITIILYNDINRVVVIFYNIVILLLFLNGQIPRRNQFDQMRVVRLIFKYSARARRRRELIRIQISLSVPGGNRYFICYNTILYLWRFFSPLWWKQNKKTDIFIDTVYSTYIRIIYR